MIITIDNAVIDVPFIYKYFHTLTIIKEPNLEFYLSLQDDNNTHTFIDKNTKGQIIKKHNLYFSKHKAN